MVIIRLIDTTTTLPAEARSAGLARRFVSVALHESGHEGLDDIATLLASELVTNAVLHARSAVELRLRIDGGRVRVEVHDRSTKPVAPRHFTSDAATGRGLLLVTELAAAWGSDAGPDGKCVWFELLEGREQYAMGESA